MKMLGGTTVTVGEKVLSLVPSFAGIVACEEKLGMNLTEIILNGLKPNKGTSISMVTTVFWGWLFKDGKETIDHDDLGNMLLANNWPLQIPVVIQLVHAAIAGVSFDEIAASNSSKKKKQ